jgi:hypothetical protein
VSSVRRSSSLPTDERIVVWIIFLLAALPAWLRGGTHAPWTQPVLVFSIVSFLVLVGLSWARRRRPGVDPSGAPGSFINLRDPLFWLGAAFLLLLVLQWWNAGRVLFYDSADKAWAYSPPRHVGWPSAITRLEARQMLDWFVPAWVILVAIRSPGFSAVAVRRVWRLMVFNAALLALFGIVQFISGTTRMYWLVQMRPHFFASFGYPNHAGSYFLMTMCMAAGLLAHDIGPGGGFARWARRIGLGAAFLLSLVGANLSLSRLAVMLSWLLVIPLAALWIRFLWPRLEPVRRVHVVAAALAIISLAGLLTLGLGRDAIRKEFKPEDDNKTFMDRETSFRWFQMKSAVQVWRDHPWCGVGGWGYRYLIGHYVPRDLWRKITEGKANVHNDPVQFLAEFGLWGAGAMAAVVVILLAGAWRVRAGWPPIFLLPLMGLVLVWMQSLIDLPFRSPAVVNLWLIALAGVARVAAPRKTPPPSPPATLQIS